MSLRQSKIEKYLKMDLNPVAILWTDHKPAKALQYKPGKFGCSMHLAAEAAKGKTAVLDADTSGCFTAAAAFGFGKIQDRWLLDMDLYYAFLSCGAMDGEIEEGLKEAIRESSKQGSSPRNALQTMMEGEGYKKSREIVKEYIDSLPDLPIKEKYVVMKPLKEVDSEKETPVQVVFFVNPNQLSALVKLANFRSGKSDRIKVSGGSACQDIGIYAYQEARADNPKAILGLTDVYARNNLKRSLGSDKLSLTIPMKLFMTMEDDADESLLVRATWKELSAVKN